ncbi:ATP-binding cassette sub-family C member 4-like isoform X1 [Cervus elaphus]|uniref:ATP-binding cassette sub-family C member 4-like isoform X1 n=1 Tax=Cervus elaphus TaxID=9860 RepID=UPI001CC2DEED|nr:ATP-binding cassette sub-family C member 4-like isoform X1 [Cervus elaphus]
MLPVSPEVKSNPLQKANFCSRLFVWWLNPLFKIGHKRKLEPDDMYSVLPEDRSQRLGEELQGYWDQEVKRAQKDAQEPSLMKAIIKCYWKSYLIWGVFTFLEEGTRVVQPIFLGKMISYVENYDPNDSVALHEAYGYAAGLSACVLVWAVLHHLYFYHIQRVGMRLRVAVCHMIYGKALRLSSSAMRKTTTGQIVNLLSNDVSRFDQVMTFLHYLWVGPLQAIAVTTLLWMEIGMSCLAGMAVLIILLLLQSCIGKLFSSLRSKIAALTDDRIRTMSEVITGVRTIKVNAWEKSFIDLITELRRKEISKILRSSYLRGINLASFFAVSKIMIFVTFISNVVRDNMITASQVFVVVTLFEALRCSSTLYFPMAIEKVSEVIVSIQRIKNFLLLDEMSQYYPQLPSDGKMIVDVQAFTASWEKEATRVVQPIFLGKMVSYVENYDPTNSAALHEAYAYAAGLSASMLVWAVLHHLYFYHIQRVGMRLRVAVCHMIYHKALRLSSSSRGKTTTGQIVNLLSNDVNRFDQVTTFLHYLWLGPLQAITVTALLWMEIGMSCLAGMAVAIILLLLQSCIGKLFSSLWSKTTALTDDRIRTMSEVITGIRTIKMNVWEKSFIDLITSLRRKEISKILRSSYLRGMNLASFFAMSKIMIFVTFISNVVLDNLITGSQAFVVVTLFEALRCSSTLYFPMAIEKVSETVVSIQRIKNFLLLDEISQCYLLLPSDGKTIVDVQAFTASWEKASKTPTLQGLSFTVRPGELLAVVGHVGAGKSSLLRALLGELPPSQGTVSVHGRIAYVSQQPWVFPGTVRSNILFGKKYEKKRYEEVIKACALEADLQLLEEEDLTEIAERGTPLSEGQKARVSLARAVYQDADIYLLDDPFSAVDAIVSRHLFERCIRQALKEKITILVTHQLQYLKYASQILTLKDGITVKRGTYSEFLKSGIDIFSLFEKGNEQSEPSAVPGTPSVISESLVQSLQSPRPSLKDTAQEDQETENIQVTLPLEDHLEGKVGFKTYKNYFTDSADWSVIIFLILVNIAAQVTYALQDWWLAFWAKVQNELYFGVYVKEDEDVVFILNWYLGVYSGLTVSTVLLGITRSLLIFYILANSSQALHNKMLESILRAPVLFFHKNPIGRILNRFSKDIGHMDYLLPLIFLDFIQTFLLVIGVVVVMVAAIPWTAIPVIPFGISFFFLRRYFLETSRDVKRLECTTRSPVFSHLASSLRGLWTIRAYKAEQKFQELFDAHQDLHSEAWFLLLMTSRWLAVYLDVICAIFVTVIAFGALILVETLDAGHVGLVLSLTITLTSMFQWCVRQSVEVENMMISVERVIEYTDLVKEAPWELEYRPPPSWPNKGVISFNYVNFRHKSDGPLVLRNMYADIYSGQKYGIVGRTGAGKSSLIAALFRLSEPEGDICIDDILTVRIGLHDLRKKMSVALQEPVLFTGTMRKNLDPFNERTDKELWNALEEVQLKESIEGLPAKMNTELAESGLNLSVGQKQLVCLARAILRKNQILIIDKATSYVDPRTDELIQKKIRKRFAKCTVLTIAHRLSTIIDCEWIMVLDSGTWKECSLPYFLLQDRNSLFYKMVQQLGKAEAAVLTKRVK